MDFQEKEKSEENYSKASSDIAKDQFSPDHVEDAEEAILHNNDEADAILDQIPTEILKVNPNEFIPDPTDKHLDEETQKQLDIEAQKQLENAQYVKMNTNRFKMRAKALSLEVSVILSKYENEIANEANNTVIPVRAEIENLLIKTLNAINIPDLGEVEKYLIKAEKIYNDAYAKIPKNIKSTNNDTPPVFTEPDRPKHRPGAREKAELKGNEGDENRCILIAEAAIKDKDYAKAEKFLVKAERLRPTKVAKKLLIVVRDLASKKESAETIISKSHEPEKDLNTTSEDKQQLVMKLTKIAETRINDKNYEGATTMLEKAEQLFPTTAAKELLQKIDEIKAREKALNRANICLSVAKCKEDDGDFDSAEKYLLEAQDCCPDIDISESLLRIKDARTEKLRTEEPLEPIETSEIPNNLVNLVKMIESEARNAIALGNYDEAEAIVTDFKENFAGADVDGILWEIHSARETRSSTTKIAKIATDDKVCEQKEQSSDILFKLAQVAIQSQDFITAKEFLMIALSIDVNDEAVSLLKDIQNRKQIQMPQQSFTEHDYRNAEKLRLKAQELSLSKEATDFLKKLGDARREDNIKNYNLSKKYEFSKKIGDGKKEDYNKHNIFEKESKNYRNISARDNIKILDAKNSIKPTKATLPREPKRILQTEQVIDISGVSQRKTSSNTINASILEENAEANVKNNTKKSKKPWKKIGCCCFTLFLIIYLWKIFKIRIVWG